MGLSLGYAISTALTIYKIPIQTAQPQQGDQINPMYTETKTTDTPKLDTNKPLAIDPKPSCAYCDKLPVIIFTPGGLFTENEKAELTKKVTDPFFDFYNADSIEYIAMTIEKYQPLPAHGYKYNINAININSGYLGFLFGQSTPLEWWLPECMGGCNFTQEFQTKYPEIVEALN